MSAGQDMQVNMEYGLPGVSAIIDNRTVSLTREIFECCDLCCR